MQPLGGAGGGTRLQAPEQRRQGDSNLGDAHEVTVLVVDDHPGFRDALADLIAASPGFVLKGMACSGEEAIAAVDDLAPELVLMDVVMPGMGGISAARAIRRSSPSVMVVLTSVNSPALYPGASELGDEVASERKQDLGPRRLQELWTNHHG